MENKHAYLIIAHTNWEQLQTLINTIDDERNDIYIHIDKKVNVSNLELHTKHSKIEFTQRLNIRWGNIVQIEAEYLLFERASQTYHAYYHLISGFDLPLHNQDYIHDFFIKNNGLEFIGYGSENWDVKNRVICHNIFMKYMRHKILAVRYLLKILRLLYNKIQLLFNKSNKEENNYRYGCNWVSITHDLVINLLKNRDDIIKTYKYSYCPDEIYKQSFVINSKFKSKIFDINNEFNSCMREIDWKRGRPYTWKKNDYDYLASSNKLFARKFDERVDKEIIHLIVKKIDNEKYKS